MNASRVVPGPRTAGSNLTGRQRLEYPCPECGAWDWKVGRIKISDGRFQFPYFCANCKGRTTIFETKERASRDGFEDIEYEPSKGRAIPCVVCGSDDHVELHHFAPVHIFGNEEAERWPRAFLCRRCHQRWHWLIQQHRKTGKPGSV